MGEQLHFSMDGEFLTAIARDWFWKMDKPYKKCEELLLSCMMGGNEEEKRHVCQDIIEGRKKLVGVNEFELVDDNVHVRSLGQKVEELQHKMLVNQIREDMIAHPLNYVDRFAMTDSYETLCTNAKHHYIDCSYDGIKCFLYGKTGYSDAFNNGAWLFTHPDLVAEFNGEPLPEQESNPEFYKTDFWTKLASWIEANMKGTSVERRQRLYNSYISDRPIQHQLTEYGLIAPDGTWYACEFGEHAALAGRIIMRNREAFGLSDHEVLNILNDSLTPFNDVPQSDYTVVAKMDVTNDSLGYNEKNRHFYLETTRTMIPTRYTIEMLKMQALIGLVDELRANTTWQKGVPFRILIRTTVFVDGIEDVSQATTESQTITL